jgi:hypothetical protein
VSRVQSGKGRWAPAYPTPYEAPPPSNLPFYIGLLLLCMAAVAIAINVLITTP